MRLDHLLSKREEVGVALLFRCRGTSKNSGGDALKGHTRSHPEHEGKDLDGRWYYAGDGMGEQVAAGL